MVLRQINVLSIAMAKSTSIEALQRFTRGIVNLYYAEYLRALTLADLKILLAKVERRGFSGMIGSIDCMHWQWKNCPTGWAGEYSCRKHIPTIILKAVASYDTWIWYVFFGMPRACNDLRACLLTWNGIKSGGIDSGMGEFRCLLTCQGIGMGVGPTCLSGINSL
ncbi:hypothetical protein ACLB2K_048064 [Fragaria x ananassa]